MISLIKKLIFKNSCNTQIDIFKDYKFLKLYKKYKQYSMTSIERMYALYKASDYIIKACVPGDIVECGVWKGGSIMLSAAVFLSNKNQKRKFYLYDTFEGLTKPGNRDFDIFGQDARVVWWKNQKWLWTSVSEQEVRKSLSNSEFNLSDFIFVKGDVLNTIPKKIPNKIALLRLDTDWYKSTKHELEHISKNRRWRCFDY